MGDTGKMFKTLFPEQTPATSVVATEDWDGGDMQSAYYDCQNYTVNFFKYKKQLFIRAWYVFDENVKDTYYNDVCKTFDAKYENLPVVDTVEDADKENIGIVIGENEENFTATREDENTLLLRSGNKAISASEKGLSFRGYNKLILYRKNMKNIKKIEKNRIVFEYNGTEYRISVINGTIAENSNEIIIEGKEIALLV